MVQTFSVLDLLVASQVGAAQRRGVLRRAGAVHGGAGAAQGHGRGRAAAARVHGRHRSGPAAPPDVKSSCWRAPCITGHLRDCQAPLSLCTCAAAQIEPLSIGCGLWRTGSAMARRGVRPDRASCHRAVRVPEGHGRDRQPVAPGVGGQPQRARAAGEHGGGGRAHQDLHALVAALAPRRGRRLGHPGPLQGAEPPPAAAPAIHRPALHAAAVGCSMAELHNEVGSLLALPRSAGQAGARWRCGNQTRVRRQDQAGLSNSSIPHASCLPAMLRPWPHDVRSLKERCCISLLHMTTAFAQISPALACL